MATAAKVLCGAWLAIAAACSSPAWAWHEEGHQSASRWAVAALGKDSMPEFFLAGAGAIAHESVDPDLFMRPIAPPELADAESPEHHFDVELLEGNAPPPPRYEYLAFCAARKIDPRKAGLLPFAVTEWTQRLTVALAEHRKWPDNPLIQQKCLLYAGILSHYGADLCQPLHTTIHYDGRAGADGNTPHSGIHNKVDALLGKLVRDANRPPADPKPAPFDNVMAAVLTEVAASHALVEKVYELEKDLPAYEAPLVADSPAGRFADERLWACARFVASLYLTAWRDSQKIKLPAWHHRESIGDSGERTKGPSGERTADFDIAATDAFATGAPTPKDREQAPLRSR
jgi:hypothetical protein